MESPYTDLGRPPLSAERLATALVRPGGLWTELRVVAATGSTNTDVAAAAGAGVREGLVLVAERQDAGKGRLGRVWTSPARAGLHVSVLLRPGRADDAGHPPVPAARYGWLPLLAGVALAGTVRRLAVVEAALKWPNDLLVGPVGERPAGKCAGILAEAVPDPDGSGPAVVLGIGLNVSLRADELPRADATSLALAGATLTDRDPLLRGLLRDLASWYERFRAAAGDPVGSGLLARYREECATLGQQVRVELPDDTTLTGTASDVDADGRLVVTPAGGTPVTLAAGDVTHVRPAT
ncbi:biotin--[acetyl-CoA-carboxylase] ligase [Actinocatenispora rupis]|uniref:biotin--[biotin carboxyl-carrier protein] ligase n=1 Tax=Actinocatenispora rupis TaxID=519421 RepID=A0A8J3IXJ0_9ACTN|nr:biotin--[acetyl-CoA-carboxylase] ligase [Actinocatenispora rupis]GID11861.1 biotin--[acetyl-CoA-carboxylase] ligase [Actinocatenispora rupis]